ncbi:MULTISPECIES: metal ABC transporter permease [unclassified Anaerococcus]|uniref:metal ABC transporter permease n=1 Tax=unclassified Anaerococcus TaxID=2614126 RepID=UPI0021C79117|nr:MULTISPECIES: metal ABC transporter permease [unclassified Anaerococcus]
MRELLSMYSFQIVLIGTVLLAIVASIIGTINVYKNQSLIGDALGHSTLPGIVLAFMITRQRDPAILLIGAMATAALSYFLIHYCTKNSKIGADANMAIFLSGFFGLGLVLKSFIQGNPSYSGSARAGLDNYIFGQAAYLLRRDIDLLLIATIICLVIVAINFRDIKAYLFDNEFSYMIGVKQKLLDYLILFMTILVIGVGIKAVGVILISSLLIIPTITASYLTNEFMGVMALSALLSTIASLAGCVISTIFPGFSTGPTIILFQGMIALLVIVITKITQKGARI